MESNTLFSVTIPLINPNEPEAVIASLYVQEGERIEKGKIICILETTKSTNEVIAEMEGFVVGLHSSEGQIARAGDRLCYLVPALDVWESFQKGSNIMPEKEIEEQALPPDLRISKPALALARQHGVDFSRLPVDRLVTQKMIEEILSKKSSGVFFIPEMPFDSTAILIYGGGGHGKALIDLVRALGTYHIIGIIDDGFIPGEQIMGVPVLGGADQLAEMYQRGVRLAVNAVGGIGNVSTRVRVFQILSEAGFASPALVHPRAYVEPGAVLAAGSQVFAFGYVGSEARIGFGSIINTGAIVSHDCVLGEYVNISPGATLAGEVTIGTGTLVGMQATVNLRVKIGTGVKIGNGATIKADISDGGIVRAGTNYPP
jgi:sugar O-acyltransferase (sialic acid O-acetyltransferase NeuD family)